MTRWTPDVSLRIDHERNTVLGGSPLKLLWLTDSGIALVERMAASGFRRPLASNAVPDPLSSAEAALVDRLVDSGLIHPLPEPGTGPFTAADVTIVIPVKDDSPRLAALVEAIARTTPDVAGVIVVDDGSAPPVDLSGHGSKLPVRVVRRGTSGGPGVARMDGLEMVTTDLVAFIDVDCTPTTGWLDVLLGHFTDPHVVVVAPRVSVDQSSDRRSAAGVRAALDEYDERHSPLDLGAQPARVSPCTRVSYVPSAALVVKTGAVLASGGFDPDLRFGEDVDLIWRLAGSGARIRYEPRAVVHHEVRSGLWAWLRQRFSYGSSAAPLAKRHGDVVAPAVMSRWSLTVWLLVAAGHRRAALSIAGLSALLFARKVPGCSAADVVRVVGVGHLGAGRQLATTLVRVWWPLALAASIMSKRARRVVAAAVLWQIIDHRPSGAADVALGLADDMAYGAGVWVGCLRERSFEALRPRLN